MTRRILTIALAVFAFALAASPAQAAKTPHRYSPRHGAKCRKHYRRVKHGRKVFCVRKATKAAPKAPASPLPAAEKVKLHSHLDPTFTRDPMDPFKVTYAYSASATQEVVAAPQTARASAVEETAPLPSGVLSFFSDGKLECAINVGSGISGSECPVTYQALGEHRVTTIYSSGEQSATETEVDNIQPLPTTSTLTTTYTSEVPTEAGVASGLWRVGILEARSAASPPFLAPSIGCGASAASERLDGSGCYQLGASSSYVFVESTGACLTKVYLSKETGDPGVVGGAAEVTAEGLTAAAVSAGTYHLRAVVGGSGGYAISEAITPLQIDPEYEGQSAC